MKKQYNVVAVSAKKETDQSNLKDFHIYFTSDEEVKKGAIVTDGVSVGGIGSIDGRFYPIECFDGGAKVENKSLSLLKGLRVIIASTDKALGLPLIPESFVYKFTEGGGKIKHVVLEVEPYGVVRAEIEGIKEPDDAWLYPEWARPPMVDCKGWKPKTIRGYLYPLSVERAATNKHTEVSGLLQWCRIYINKQPDSDEKQRLIEELKKYEK